MYELRALSGTEGYERLSQIDPDEINTAEQLIEALRAVHEEMQVTDPVACLLKKDLDLFIKSWEMINSSYQFLKGYVVTMMDLPEHLLPEIYSRTFEIDAGGIGSLYYLLSTHATWEITQENKDEMKFLISVASKLQSILAQVYKNPSQYMNNIVKFLIQNNPRVKILVDYNIQEPCENRYFPFLQGTRSLLTCRINFFEAVQAYQPYNEASDRRVIGAFNDLMSVLPMSSDHIRIRKDEQPWLLPEDESAREEEIADTAKSFGMSVEQLKEARRSIALERALKDEIEPKEDLAQRRWISTPAQQKFISQVLQNVTLCISLKLLFDKNKEYAFSGSLLEHANLVIELVNANHTVKGNEKEYNLPTQHLQYALWLQKSNLPLTAEKNLCQWDGVKIGRKRVEL